MISLHFLPSGQNLGSVIGQDAFDVAQLVRTEAF